MALPYVYADASAGSANPPSIEPRCNASAARSADEYKTAVCSSRKLRDTAKRADELAGVLRPRLPQSLRAVLDRQQGGFSSLTGYCPNHEAFASCISQALNARVRDLEDLHASLGKAIRECKTVGGID
ncbi:hypothetical protein GCM10011491_44660 [Brucella endophytica]|uniref:Uncharacterized protein n=1 Tax=Brucella endophytica TaxID=1963359 RepID=A0A916SPP3_9HYPH|nr:hypothetical protein [Brucella endophytica]GGB11814.1 hypothetical protein GCM10011491_44660 [Brucella endophytica]